MSALFEHAVATIDQPEACLPVAAAWCVRAHEPVAERRLTAFGDRVATWPGSDWIMLWFGLPRGDPGVAVQTLLSLDLLAPDEQARLHRFVHNEDRWSFAAAHAGLRLILADRLGVAPRALCFQTGAQGKPHLPGGPFFNLSHTRGLVAVAIANAPVGVDVETVKDMPDLVEVAAHAFAPESCRAVRQAPTEDKQALFFRHWTLGEAFIKATGLGVSQDLKSFAFTSSGAPRLTRVTPGWGPAVGWQFGLHMPAAPAR